MVGSLVNICSRREVRGIAADIYGIFRLIYTDPVHPHNSRKYEVSKVNLSKISRYGQIHDEILIVASVQIT